MEPQLPTFTSLCCLCKLPLPEDRMKLYGSGSTIVRDVIQDIADSVALIIQQHLFVTVVIRH